MGETRQEKSMSENKNANAEITTDAEITKGAEITTDSAGAAAGAEREKPTARRVAGMVVGIVIISLGIAIFKESHLGNDSISALNMRVAEIFGISLGVQNLMLNIAFFVLQIAYGRKYIGLGTIVNGVGVGFAVTFFFNCIAGWVGAAGSFPEQLLWVLAGVVITSFGCSLYQTADLGLAPYDYLSIGLRDHTPFPYFGCRVFTDTLAALICFLLGGLVGIGTLVCAFCLGPFIQFYNRHISEKLLQYVPAGQEKKTETV